jgi:hypothetical protein
MKGTRQSIKKEEARKFTLNLNFLNQDVETIRKEKLPKVRRKLQPLQNSYSSNNQGQAATRTASHAIE